MADKKLYSKVELEKKPPYFVKNNELWIEAVRKATYDGSKDAGYGATIAIYKNKGGQINEEQITDLTIPDINKMGDKEFTDLVTQHPFASQWKNKDAFNQATNRILRLHGKSYQKTGKISSFKGVPILEDPIDFENSSFNKMSPFAKFNMFIGENGRIPDLKKWMMQRKNHDRVDEDSPWTNKELNEVFWRDGKFDESVRRKLLKIAEDFYQGTGYDAKVIDIQLTGSNANFNYNSFSDLDVHIIIDMAEIDENEDLVKQAVDGKRWIFNKQHDISIRGYNVEVYIQGVDEQHAASGLFSLLNNKWVAEPVYTEPKTDPSDVQLKANSFKSEIDNLEKELNDTADTEEIQLIHDRLSHVRSGIIKMRKEALLVGDTIDDKLYSVENLAFKELRNSGYIEKAIDLSNKSYDMLFTEKE